jgi:hypothetical protein
VLGPKAARRAAAWAVGVSGFSLNLDVDAIREAVEMAATAWDEAGREDRPRFVTACFYALGSDAPGVLRRFTETYFEIFGAEAAHVTASEARLSDETSLAEALARVEANTDADEVILVPAGVDSAMASATADLVASLTDPPRDRGP